MKKSSSSTSEGSSPSLSRRNSIGKNSVNLSFTPIDDKKRKPVTNGYSGSSSGGLVTPVNSTEVTPPSLQAFPTGSQGQQPSVGFDGGSNMFEGGTPGAMQIDSDRGADWEWWTMVM